MKIILAAQYFENFKFHRKAKIDENLWNLKELEISLGV